MNMLLEYYLTGGKLRIGKKEVAFELLRKDSVLRSLLGHNAGELNSLMSKRVATDTQEDYVILDFNQAAERKLSTDPTPMLNELKQRYGSSVGGMLNFKCVYTTFNTVYFLKADLDSDKITLCP